MALVTPLAGSGGWIRVLRRRLDRAGRAMAGLLAHEICSISICMYNDGFVVVTRADVHDRCCQLR